MEFLSRGPSVSVPPILLAGFNKKRARTPERPPAPTQVRTTVPKPFTFQAAPYKREEQKEPKRQRAQPQPKEPESKTLNPFIFKLQPSTAKTAPPFPRPKPKPKPRPKAPNTEMEEFQLKLQNFFNSLSANTRTLGKGSFGTVFERKAPGIGPLAVKEIECSPLDPVVLRELTALEVGRSRKNLASLIHAQAFQESPVSSSEDPLDTFGHKFLHSKDMMRLALPLAIHGTLEDQLPNVKDLAPWQLLGIVYQIFCALSTLHSLGLIHYDLKPQNILVTQDWPTSAAERSKIPVIEIADPGHIGWQNAAYPTPANQTITADHRPPDFLCQGENVDRKFRFQPTTQADIFSAAVVMMTLFTAWVYNKDSDGNWLAVKPERIKDPRYEIYSLRSAEKFFESWSNIPSQFWNDTCVEKWKGSSDEKRRELYQQMTKDKEALFSLWLSTLFRRLQTFKGQEQTSHQVRQKLDQSWVEPFLRLIERGMSFEPSKRPTAQEAMKEIQTMMTLSLDESKFTKDQKAHILKSIHQTLTCPSVQKTEEWKILSTPSSPSSQATPRFNPEELKPLTSNHSIQALLLDMYHRLQSVLSGQTVFKLLTPGQTRRNDLVRDQVANAYRALVYFKTRHHPDFPDTYLPALFLLLAIWIAPFFDSELESSMCSLSRKIEMVTGISLQDALIQIVQSYPLIGTREQEKKTRD